jgi:hypothetical protein
MLPLLARAALTAVPGLPLPPPLSLLLLRRLVKLRAQQLPLLVVSVLVGLGPPLSPPLSLPPPPPLPPLLLLLLLSQAEARLLSQLMRLLINLQAPQLAL